MRRMTEEIIEEIEAYRATIERLVGQRDAARGKVRALHKELAEANSQIARLERERAVLASGAKPWWQKLFG